MAQSHLPTGPYFPKPAHSPAQGPGDTLARPAAPKTTRPQTACAQPDLADPRRASPPNTIPPPSAACQGEERPPEPGSSWPSQPAQGPGDTHAHPTNPKTTGPQPAVTQSDRICQQRPPPPNTIPPPSLGEKRPPEPGFPLTSQPAVGDEVLARQASFSRTWHRAVVTATNESKHRTTCDILWDDGSHTRALPLSRVRRLSPDAPRHAADPPQPGRRPPPATPPSGATAPPGGQPQRPLPSEPTADPPPGTLVDARQSRHSQWHPATILSHHGPHNRRTFTVRWSDTSDGDHSSGIPRSRIRFHLPSPLHSQPSPPPPPAHPPPRTSPEPPDPPSTLRLQAPSSPPHARSAPPGPDGAPCHQE